MNDTLETVQVYGAQMDAELARMLLESHEIPAFIIDGQMVSTNSLLSNAIGGIRLQVRHDDLHRAKEILTESAAKKTAEAGDWGVCTSCGSTQLEPRRHTRGVFLTILLFGFPLWFARTRLYCRACGYSMRMSG